MHRNPALSVSEAPGPRRASRPRLSLVCRCTEFALTASSLGFDFALVAELADLPASFRHVMTCCDCGRVGGLHTGDENVSSPAPSRIGA